MMSFSYADGSWIVCHRSSWPYLFRRRAHTKFGSARDLCCHQLALLTDRDMVVFFIYIFLSFLSRLSYLSSNSPSIKRRSLDRPASSQSHGGNSCFLRPSSAQYQYQRRRLSDNNFQRTSVTSQTSSLHTALSELAGDVEVVDMEDGALTNDRYSHNDYQGMMALSSFYIYIGQVKSLLRCCRGSSSPSSQLNRARQLLPIGWFLPEKANDPLECSNSITLRGGLYLCLVKSMVIACRT